MNKIEKVSPEKAADLMAKMNAASKALVNKGQGVENRYSLAYKELVNAGLALKLRGRYR